MRPRGPDDERRRSRRRLAEVPGVRRAVARGRLTRRRRTAADRGPTRHPRAADVPRRGPRVARGARPPDPTPELRHRSRASPSTVSGRRRSRPGGGRRCRGRRSTADVGPTTSDWLIFEEEYWRAGFARARQPERHLPPRTHDHGDRHAGAEGAVPPDDGVGRDRVGPGVERAERRLRPRQPPRHRAAHRRRTRVGAQRPEDLGIARGVGRLVLRHLPHRPRRGAPPWPHVRARPARPSGHHRAPDRAARRRHRVRRDLLRRRARPRRAHPRRGRPGLAGRDGDGRVRAGREPAQPGPVRRRRRPARRAVARRTPTRPTPRCATRSPTRGCRPRDTGCTRP